MANAKIALSYLLGQVEGKNEKQEMNTEPQSDVNLCTLPN
jgi:hypothetical protein